MRADTLLNTLEIDRSDFKDLHIKSKQNLFKYNRNDLDSVVNFFRDIFAISQTVGINYQYINKDAKSQIKQFDIDIDQSLIDSFDLRNNSLADSSDI